MQKQRTSGPTREQLEGTIEDLEVRLREVHHRVRRQLQLIASLLSMQAQRSEDERVSSALGDAALRILAIASIDDQLRNQSAATAVDMRGALGTIISLAQQTLEGLAPAVTLSNKIESFALPPEIAVTCGLVVNELVTNALQHAFTGLDVGCQVEVRAGSHDGRVTLVVQDNGVGMPRVRARTDNPGMGLDLVRMLVEKQLRGELVIGRARGGTRCVVTFPLPTRSTPPESGTRRAERARAGRPRRAGKLAWGT